jgi:hypothetical protein
MGTSLRTGLLAESCGGCIATTRTLAVFFFATSINGISQPVYASLFPATVGLRPRGLEEFLPLQQARRRWTERIQAISVAEAHLGGTGPGLGGCEIAKEPNRNLIGKA